jgi:hypothetical protein
MRDWFSLGMMIQASGTGPRRGRVETFIPHATVQDKQEAVQPKGRAAGVALKRSMSSSFPTLRLPLTESSNRAQAASSMNPVGRLSDGVGGDLQIRPVDLDHAPVHLLPVERRKAAALRAVGTGLLHAGRKDLNRIIDDHEVNFTRRET